MWVYVCDISDSPVATRWMCSGTMTFCCSISVCFSHYFRLCGKSLTPAPLPFQPPPFSTAPVLTPMRGLCSCFRLVAKSFPATCSENFSLYQKLFWSLPSLSLAHTLSASPPSSRCFFSTLFWSCTSLDGGGGQGNHKK